MTRETSHENPGVDYHLRALGIKDRASWEFLTRDDRTYRNEFVVARPDMVLWHKPTNRIHVVEYKSRLLGRGKPREEETWQVLIEALLVAEAYDYMAPEGQLPHVNAVLFYGDGQWRDVDYNDADVAFLYFNFVEHNTNRFDENGERIRMPASELARIMAGKVDDRVELDDLPPEVAERLRADGGRSVQEAYDRIAARTRGILAHDALRNLGPPTLR